MHEAALAQLDTDLEAFHKTLAMVWKVGRTGSNGMHFIDDPEGPLKDARLFYHNVKVYRSTTQAASPTRADAVIACTHPEISHLQILDAAFGDYDEICAQFRNWKDWKAHEPRGSLNAFQAIATFRNTLRALYEAPGFARINGLLADYRQLRREHLASTVGD